MLDVRPIDNSNRQSVADLIADHWGSSIVVSRGKVHHAKDLDGFTVYENDEMVGLITYHIENNECEIVSLDSLSENRGIGTTLIEMVMMSPGILQSACLFSKMFLLNKINLEVVVIIEIATISDLDEILALQKLAYLSEAEIYNDFSIPPLLQTLGEIRKEFNEKTFLKAVDSGKIVGSVRANMIDGTCYIGRLLVHPDYQNKGIGTALLKSIENHFKDCKRYELFTGHKSAKNLYIYQKLGYRVFREEKVTDDLNHVYLEKLP
jgi:N-acetylglutamate synthase-like GNAT family acetyltransferase